MFKRIIFAAVFLLVAPLVYFVLTGGVSSYGYKLLKDAVINDSTDQALALIWLGVPTFPNKSVESWDYIELMRNAPIQIVASTGNREIAEALLRAGTEVDWSCCASATALQEAILNQDLKMVKLLVSYGADINRYYGVEDYDSVALAEMQSSNDIVQYLKSEKGKR